LFDTRDVEALATVGGAHPVARIVILGADDCNGGNKSGL
jgi:hypothetical protein